jgi:biotin operon repressor
MAVVDVRLLARARAALEKLEVRGAAQWERLPFSFSRHEVAEVVRLVGSPAAATFFAILAESQLATSRRRISVDGREVVLEKGEFLLPRQQLADDLGLSLLSVSRHVADLERCGLLVRVQRHGGRVSNQYKIGRPSIASMQEAA